jgi:hypothetical protein
VGSTIPLTALFRNETVDTIVIMALALSINKNRDSKLLEIIFPAE